MTTKEKKQLQSLMLTINNDIKQVYNDLQDGRYTRVGILKKMTDLSEMIHNHTTTNKLLAI